MGRPCSSTTAAVMATGKILDGKALAATLRAEMADEVAAAVASGIRPPGLAVILVGEDAASQVYVRNKQKACAEAGIASLPFFLPASTNTEEVQELIHKLNAREDVDGILLQLPLPAGLDSRACLDAILPEKDVDGFHPQNMGRLALGLPGFAPCTPLGVMELLKRNGIEVSGKKVVIVGRSNIVGKPLAMMLSGTSANATVTLCHSATKNLKEECLKADILVVAIGKPRAITADMIPGGCVVVDIGINRTADGLCGDVEHAGASEKAAAITPVPGGVGPMTIAMLLSSTIKSWRSRTRQECG